MRPRVLLLLSTLAVAVPATVALPADGDFEFMPAGEAKGLMTGVLDAGSYIASYGIQGGVNATLRIASSDLQLTLIDDPFDVVETPLVGNVGNPYEIGSPPRSTRQIDAGPGAMTISQVLSNFTLVVRPTREFSITLAQANLQSAKQNLLLSSGPARDARDRTLEPFPPRVDWPNRYEIRIPEAQNHVTAPDFELHYEGPFFILLSGAVSQIENATGFHEVRTGQWRERAPGDPTGTTQGRVRSHHVVLLGNITGSLSLQYSGPYGNLVCPRLDLQDVNSLSVPIGNGFLNVEGARYSYGNQSYLDVEGQFAARLAPPSQDSENLLETKPLKVHISGDVIRIQENRLVVHLIDARYAAVAATGVSLLVLAYAVVSWVRRGSVWIAARYLEYKFVTILPLAAKVEVGQVLQHPVRRGIMAILEADPALRQLSEVRRLVASAHGVSTMAAYKHIRTLWAAGQIGIVAVGRRYYVGPRAGPQIQGRRAVTALLRQPIGRTIADYWCTHPGATQRDTIRNVQEVVRRGHRRSLSNVAVLKWIQKFERLTRAESRVTKAFGSSFPNERLRKGSTMARFQAIRKERDGATVRYHPTTDLHEVVKALRKESSAANLVG